MSIQGVNRHEVGYRTGGMIMDMQSIQNLVERPVANQAAEVKEVMRRGGQLMVIFAGCPAVAEMQALRDADVSIGLALSAGDVAGMPSLDGFNYVFLGQVQDRARLLRKAVTDLAHNGWTVDDEGIANAEQVEPRAPRAPMHSSASAMAYA